jgi:hypothetical protein
MPRNHTSREHNSNPNHSSIIQSINWETNWQVRSHTGYTSKSAPDDPPWSLSTCSTSNTGSRNALWHFGQTSTVTLPLDCEFVWWDFSTCSIKAPAVENLDGQWTHCSTRPLLLLLLLLLFGEIPSVAFWKAWLVAMLSFCIPASADVLKFDAAFRRLELHHEELFLLLFERVSTFWLLLSIFEKVNEESIFLGPGHLWSGPNLCFRQCSLVQSLHLIVFENVSVSLHPRTGHFLLFVTFW